MALDYEQLPAHSTEWMLRRISLDRVFDGHGVPSTQIDPIDAPLSSSPTQTEPLSNPWLSFSAFGFKDAASSPELTKATKRLIRALRTDTDLLEGNIPNLTLRGGLRIGGTRPGDVKISADARYADNWGIFSLAIGLKHVIKMDWSGEGYPSLTAPLTLSTRMTLNSSDSTSIWLDGALSCILGLDDIHDTSSSVPFFKEFRSTLGFESEWFTFKAALYLLKDEALKVSSSLIFPIDSSGASIKMDGSYYPDSETDQTSISLSILVRDF